MYVKMPDCHRLKCSWPVRLGWSLAMPGG